MWEKQRNEKWFKFNIVYTFTISFYSVMKAGEKEEEEKKIQPMKRMYCHQHFHLRSNLIQYPSIYHKQNNDVFVIFIGEFFFSSLFILFVKLAFSFTDICKLFRYLYDKHVKSYRRGNNSKMCMFLFFIWKPTESVIYSWGSLNAVRMIYNDITGLIVYTVV